jgi:hypothetical protein
MEKRVRKLRLQSPHGKELLVESTDRHALIRAPAIVFEDAQQQVHLQSIVDSMKQVSEWSPSFCVLHIDYTLRRSFFAPTLNNLNNLNDLNNLNNVNVSGKNNERNLLLLPGLATWSSTFSFARPRQDQPGIYIAEGGCYELSLHMSFQHEPQNSNLVFSFDAQDVLQLRATAFCTAVLPSRPNSLFSVRLVTSNGSMQSLPVSLSLKLQRVNSIRTLSQRFEIKEPEQSDDSSQIHQQQDDEHDQDLWETGSTISEISLLEGPGHFD